MKCCGEQRTTAFCCDCGKNLSDSPIYGLLKHVQTQMKKWQREIEYCDVHISEASESAWHKRRNFQATRAHKKWQAWEHALVELMTAQAKIVPGL